MRLRRDHARAVVRYLRPCNIFRPFAPVPLPLQARQDAHPPATLLKSSGTVAGKKSTAWCPTVEFLFRDHHGRLQQCSRWMVIFCRVWRGKEDRGEQQKILHDLKRLIKARTWSLFKRILILFTEKPSCWDINAKLTFIFRLICMNIFQNMEKSISYAKMSLCFV